MSTEYVYLINEVGTTNHKIGRSRHPKRRLAALQTASSAELALIVTLATPDAARLEAELHSRYSSCHIRGEWFKLDSSQVAEIQTWKAIVPLLLKTLGDVCSTCSALDIKYPVAIEDLQTGHSFKATYYCEVCNKTWPCWWEKGFAAEHAVRCLQQEAQTQNYVN